MEGSEGLAITEDNLLLRKGVLKAIKRTVLSVAERLFAMNNLQLQRDGEITMAQSSTDNDRCSKCPQWLMGISFLDSGT